MQSQFGCFISAGSLIDGHPEWIVPAEFVGRATDHIARTGQPYLAHHDDDYRITIVARPVAHGRYEMRGAEVLERTLPSWRQLYWHRYGDRLSQDAFRAWFRFTESEWDAPAESAAADAMVLGGWRRITVREGVHPLGGLEIPRFRADAEAPSPGRLYWLEGSPTAAGRILMASSALALSCLQFWLDELGAGIRVQVREDEAA
jgi:hypothetical protein